MGKILGISGRQGSGKSSISGYLTTGLKTEKFMKISDPLSFISSVIFGWNYSDLVNPETRAECEPDPIWGLTPDQAQFRISEILMKYIGAVPVPGIREVSVPNYDIKNGNPLGKWIEYSFADPLKKIAPIIFDFGIPDLELYKILQGLDPELRIKRESITSIEYPVCGKLTGRECLEYLGTNVLRDGFDKEIWIKIFKREAQKLNPDINLVIPDVRFWNEKKALKELHATNIVVFRNPDDLIITEADRKSHPSKWEFLSFIESSDIMIPNTEDLEKLYININKLILSLMEN